MSGLLSTCFGPGVKDSDKPAILDTFRRDLSADESATDALLLTNVATKGFLEDAGYDLDLAKTNWKACQTWRAKNHFNAIRLEDIKYEAESCLARWIGYDIKGRPVLVITPRLNYSMKRKGVRESFKKFFVKTIEIGLQLCERCGQDKVAVVYDRRALDIKHIDNFLYTMLRETIDSCRTHYGKFLDYLLVLDSNIVFWTFYHLVLRPIFYFSTISQRLQLLDTPEELLTYIDKENCHLMDPAIKAETLYEMIIEPRNICLAPDPREAESAPAPAPASSSSSSSTDAPLPPALAPPLDDTYEHFCSVNARLIDYYREGHFDLKLEEGSVVFPPEQQST